MYPFGRKGKRLFDLIKTKFEEMGFEVETNNPLTYDKTLRHKVKIEKTDQDILFLE